MAYYARKSMHPALKVLSPRRWAWGLIAVVAVLWYWLVAAVQVAHLVLHPDPPVQPGVIRAKTRLAGPGSRAALRTLLAVAPGVLVVDAADDGSIELHCLVAGGPGRDDARRVLAQFEDLIERVVG
jgi:multisubunit Na+/H+ antiporter MnhE subunit